VCRLDPHALDTELLACFGQRDLRLLLRPEEPLDRTVPLGQLACGPDDLARVEQVVDTPVAGEDRLEICRERLERVLTDDGEPHVREPGDCRDDPDGGLREPGGGVDHERHDGPPFGMRRNR
jgi:hypothetical protein